MQFHPEVVHTPHGQEILKNFLYDVVGTPPAWTPAAVIEEQVERIRAQVGSERVICGLSGGVDSAVAALLVHKAVGDQLTCVFVDHGLLRENEAEQVVETFGGHFHVPLVHVQAQERFLTRLAGVTDPEEKRKIVGEEFIRVFEEEAGRLGDVRFLVQGTLYSDVIESGGEVGVAAKIKSHHNVGGLPADMQMELVEPLRQLFKDEVRRVGEELGLPERMVWRHPFPGPGLAIRIIGDVTEERLAILRAADSMLLEEVRKAGLYRELWQCFAVLPAVRSVGVQGDERTYAYPIVIRAVTSEDAMTADWARLPYELLETISAGSSTRCATSTASRSTSRRSHLRRSSGNDGRDSRRDGIHRALVRLARRRPATVARCAPSPAWPRSRPSSLAPAAGQRAARRRRRERTSRCEVNGRGEALVSYTRRDGARRHVLVWGAVNALPPSRERPQVRFRYDYTGGWRKYRRQVWRTFANRCRPLRRARAPARGRGVQGTGRLVLGVAALAALPARCAASTRSSPVTAPPRCTSRTGRGRCRCSRCLRTGPTAAATRGCSAGSATAAYPCTGSDADTQPLRPVCALRVHRHVRVDLRARLGARRREGDAPANGAFCFSFVPQDPPPGYPADTPRAPGNGTRHRVTIMGPGVTPVVRWEGAGLGRYDAARDAGFNALFDRLVGADDQACRAER